MRKLFLVALLAGAAWWFVNRGRGDNVSAATIGYVDGSSVTLDAGSPELDRLVEIASNATAS
jgi:hypothetical protein